MIMTKTHCIDLIVIKLHCFEIFVLFFQVEKEKKFKMTSWVFRKISNCNPLNIMKLYTPNEVDIVAAIAGTQKRDPRDTLGSPE